MNILCIVILFLLFIHFLLLGHFLLANLLVDELTAGAPSRVVSISSAAHNYSGNLLIISLH